MLYRICRVFDIESGHQLSKHPGRCRFPHGHSRRVEVVLEARRLDTRDMVCDFAVLKRVAQEVLDDFDHALCANTADPLYATLRKAYGNRIVGFTGEDPTTEVMARTLFERIGANLRARPRRPDADFPLRRGVRLVRVRVWETQRGWAEYGE